MSEGLPLALHVIADELMEQDEITWARGLGKRLQLLVPQVEELVQDALDVERLHRERDDAVLRIGVLEAELEAVYAERDELQLQRDEARAATRAAQDERNTWVAANNVAENAARAAVGERDLALDELAKVQGQLLDAERSQARLRSLAGFPDEGDEEDGPIDGLLDTMGDRLEELVQRLERLHAERGEPTQTGTYVNAQEWRRLQQERDDAVLRIGVLEAELAAVTAAGPAAAVFARRERAFTLAAGKHVPADGVDGLLRVALWIAGEAGEAWPEDEGPAERRA